MLSSVGERHFDEVEAKGSFPLARIHSGGHSLGFGRVLGLDEAPIGNGCNPAP